MSTQLIGFALKLRIQFTQNDFRSFVPYIGASIIFSFAQ